MLTEFSNILENKNKVIYDLENTIIELEHKLAEVSKDRDELKQNYCLIDGPQQKIYHKNNVNLSPPVYGRSRTGSGADKQYTNY